MGSSYIVDMSFIAVGFFSILILLGALWVVTLRNLFRAALSLGLVLLGVAGVFLSLDAPFLAFIQILVYVGAILTLVVFAIMLTARMQPSATEQVHRHRWPAAAVSLGLFALLVWATKPLVASLPMPSADATTLEGLGEYLVVDWVLPFEVISLLFVAVLVGAVALVFRPGGGLAQQPAPLPQTRSLEHL